MVSKKQLIKQWKHDNIYSSLRYCFNCEKETKFKLNHILGHSECTICRFRGEDD